MAGPAKDAGTMTYDEDMRQLLAGAGLDATYRNKAIEVLGNSGSAQVRDVKTNLDSAVQEGPLEHKEAVLIALCVAANLKNAPMIDHFRQLAAAAAATEAEIATAVACASLMACNNVLHRFRDFVGKESYRSMHPRIRMNLQVSPPTGKHTFELMSLAVSAVNGCKQCVVSHEAAILQLGASEDQVWAAVRIASVVTGADRIIH